MTELVCPVTEQLPPPVLKLSPLPYETNPGFGPGIYEPVPYLDLDAFDRQKNQPLPVTNGSQAIYLTPGVPLCRGEPVVFSTSVSFIIS